MDERTWEHQLADILKREPAALTEGDIIFLRARRSYLNEDQLITYAEVLGDAPQEEDESEDKPKRRKKSDE